MNLLAGRALTRFMHPLTAAKIGTDFDLRHALQFGGLPLACTSETPQGYLESYVATYLREEVQQEVFAKRAKRRLVRHPRFYFFDAGVFRAVRPRRPLDAPGELHGPALETLVLQHLRAWNDYRQLGYEIHYWRTARGDEVDFVLHGERGLVAFEVKMSEVVQGDDLTGLLRFSGNFKLAKLFLVHPGRRRWHDRGVEVVPFLEFASGLDEIL